MNEEVKQTYKLNLDVVMTDHYDRPLREEYHISDTETVARDITARNFLRNLLFSYKVDQYTQPSHRKEVTKMIQHQVNLLKKDEHEYAFDEVIDLVRFIDQLQIQAYIAASLYDIIPKEYYDKEEELKREEEKKRIGAAQERERAAQDNMDGAPVEDEEQEPAQPEDTEATE